MPMINAQYAHRAHHAHRTLHEFQIFKSFNGDKFKRIICQTMTDAVRAAFSPLIQFSLVSTHSEMWPQLCV